MLLLFPLEKKIKLKSDDQLDSKTCQHLITIKYFSVIFSQGRKDGGFVDG
jgi:hypothetical protein